jgi:hypothetical protein
MRKCGVSRDSLNPPYQGGGDADRSQIVARQPVITCGDAPEVLQPVEGALDEPVQLPQTLAEAERLFPVTAIGNDRLGSALVEVIAQFGAVIGLVAEHLFRVFTLRIRGSDAPRLDNRTPHLQSER